MSKNTSDKDFEKDVLQSSKPVLVDFWAEWCGPCKQLIPVIEEVAEEHKDKIEVFKINIDENPEAPTKYQVRSIPNLVLFKDGKPVAHKVGALPKGSLVSWIEENI